jgi:tetratricopeptide (TPR) repeat protein
VTVRVTISRSDFKFGPFCIAVGQLRDVSPLLQSFIEETAALIRPKELLFCNLDNHPDLGNSQDYVDCLACVHDYPAQKVVYLRLSRNSELIVSHELGHICVAGGDAESWSLADLGFTSGWMPPPLQQFLTRTANLVSDVAANKRAHVRGFDTRPLLLLQLHCHMEDCRSLDRRIHPSRLDIVHRAAQLASTAIFQEFCSLTAEESRCLAKVCDFYDDWHPGIRRLARQVRDAIQTNGYEKRAQVVRSVKQVLTLLIDAFELQLTDGPDSTGPNAAVRYDHEVLCIPEEVRARERANPYAHVRAFLNDDLRQRVAIAESAQHRFVKGFLKGAEAEKLCCEATAQFRLGHLEVAEAKAVAVLNYEHRHPAAYHLLGQISRHRGRLDVAKQCFLVALEKSAEFNRGYEDFAAAAFGDGDHEYTIGKLAFLLDAHPTQWDNPRVHEYLGRSFLASGDSKNAVNAFKNVVRLEPTSQAAMQLLHNAERRFELEYSGQARKGEPHAHG